MEKTKIGDYYFNIRDLLALSDRVHIKISATSSNFNISSLNFTCVYCIKEKQLYITEGLNNICYRHLYEYLDYIISQMYSNMCIIGCQQSIQYISNLKLHREDGPAYMGFYDTDLEYIYSKLYYKNGVLHRDNGPAVVRYYLDGTSYYKSYYYNGNEMKHEGI